MRHYEYAWVLYFEHMTGITTFALYKTERRAKNSAKKFDPKKGWVTRVEKLVLN